ncbi:MAG TPA: sirohydrochlorin chelatase [Herpetosiphonaceae bacterium]|nr:sirohydrochlorin chelatase [Herpetosiphonaceae bacterium]
MTGATTLLLAGHGSRDPVGVAEYQRFVDHLRAVAPGQRIIAAALEFAEPSIAGALRACAEQGCGHVVVQPLLLFGASHQKNDMPAAVNWARAEFPRMRISYGRHFGPHPALLTALDERIAALGDSAARPEETVILVVGRGTSDPDANSEVAQLARLFWEGRPWGWVEVAYSGETRPGVDEGVHRCVRLGARQIIVAPVLLFQGVLSRRITQHAYATAEQLGVALACAAPLGAHPALLDLTLARAAEAAAGNVAMNCDRCKYRMALHGFEGELGRPVQSDHHHGLRGIDGPTLRGLPRSVDDASPGMGAAALRYRPDGTVDWGVMWQDFCELALTGGPPVRQTPLTVVDTAIDAAMTADVGVEIARGIAETTGLPVDAVAQPGWIGFRCDDERMAVWIAAALIIENIGARFEERTVYVPVAPTWRLKYEIKNVITAVAKTCHYWQEHRPRV